MANIWLNLLVASGKALSHTAEKTALKILDKTTELQKELATRYDIATSLIGSEENMLQVLHNRLEDYEDYGEDSESNADLHLPQQPFLHLERTLLEQKTKTPTNQDLSALAGTSEDLNIKNPTKQSLQVEEPRVAVVQLKQQNVEGIVEHSPSALKYKPKRQTTKDSKIETNQTHCVHAEATNSSKQLSNFNLPSVQVKAKSNDILCAQTIKKHRELLQQNQQWSNTNNLSNNSKQSGVKVDNVLCIHTLKNQRALVETNQELDPRKKALCTKGDKELSKKIDPIMWNIHIIENPKTVVQENQSHERNFSSKDDKQLIHAINNNMLYDQTVRNHGALLQLNQQWSDGSKNDQHNHEMLHVQAKNPLKLDSNKQKSQSELPLCDKTLHIHTHMDHQELLHPNQQEKSLCLNENQLNHIQAQLNPQELLHPYQQENSSCLQNENQLKNKISKKRPHKVQMQMDPQEVLHRSLHEKSSSLQHENQLKDEFNTKILHIKDQTNPQKLLYSNQQDSNSDGKNVLNVKSFNEFHVDRFSDCDKKIDNAQLKPVTEDHIINCVAMIELNRQWFDSCEGRLCSGEQNAKSEIYNFCENDGSNQGNKQELQDELQLLHELIDYNQKIHSRTHVDIELKCPEPSVKTQQALEPHKLNNLEKSWMTDTKHMSNLLRVNARAFNTLEKHVTRALLAHNSLINRKSSFYCSEKYSNFNVTQNHKKQTDIMKPMHFSQCAQEFHKSLPPFESIFQQHFFVDQRKSLQQPFSTTNIKDTMLSNMVTEQTKHIPNLQHATGIKPTELTVQHRQLQSSEMREASGQFREFGSKSEDSVSAAQSPIASKQKTEEATLKNAKLNIQNVDEHNSEQLLQTLEEPDKLRHLQTQNVEPKVNVLKFDEFDIDMDDVTERIDILEINQEVFDGMEKQIKTIKIIDKAQEPEEEEEITTKIEEILCTLNSMKKEIITSKDLIENTPQPNICDTQSKCTDLKRNPENSPSRKNIVKSEITKRKQMYGNTVPLSSSASPTQTKMLKKCTKVKDFQEATTNLKSSEIPISPKQNMLAGLKVATCNKNQQTSQVQSLNFEEWLLQKISKEKEISNKGIVTQKAPFKTVDLPELHSLSTQSAKQCKLNDILIATPNESENTFYQSSTHINSDKISVQALTNEAKNSNTQKTALLDIQPNKAIKLEYEPTQQIRNIIAEDSILSKDTLLDTNVEHTENEKLCESTSFHIDSDSENTKSDDTVEIALTTPMPKFTFNNKQNKPEDGEEYDFEKLSTLVMEKNNEVFSCVDKQIQEHQSGTMEERQPLGENVHNQLPLCFRNKCPNTSVLLCGTIWRNDQPRTPISCKYANKHIKSKCVTKYKYETKEVLSRSGEKIKITSMVPDE